MPRDSSKEELQTGFDWLNKASDMGHIEATLVLCWMYKEKRGGLFDDLLLNRYLDFGYDALRSLKRLATPQDQEKSETLFKKALSLLTVASSDEDCKAFSLRELICGFGDIFGQSDDKVRAAEWEQKAAECYLAKAEAGDYQAMYEIAEMYKLSGGVEKDYAAALKWLLKSAEAGNPEAVLRLGYWHHYELFALYAFFLEFTDRIEVRLPWLPLPQLQTSIYRLNEARF